MRLRTALDAIERPHLDRIDGLRELLALRCPSEHWKVWKDALDAAEYERWWRLSDLYDQVS